MSTATWRLGDAVGFGYDDPPNPLFNRVIGLGVLGPATDDALAEAIKPWAGRFRSRVPASELDRHAYELTGTAVGAASARARSLAVTTVAIRKPAARTARRRIPTYGSIASARF